MRRRWTRCLIVTSGSVPGPQYWPSFGQRRGEGATHTNSRVRSESLMFLPNSSRIGDAYGFPCVGVRLGRCSGLPTWGLCALQGVGAAQARHTPC